MKGSTLMTSGMDLEEELLQMETILLANGKKEWGMDGADMFIIPKQISLRSLILSQRSWLLLKRASGKMMNLLDSNKQSLKFNIRIY